MMEKSNKKLTNKHNYQSSFLFCFVLLLPMVACSFVQLHMKPLLSFFYCHIPYNMYGRFDCFWYYEIEVKIHSSRLSVFLVHFADVGKPYYSAPYHSLHISRSTPFMAFSNLYHNKNMIKISTSMITQKNNKIIIVTRIKSSSNLQPAREHKPALTHVGFIFNIKLYLINRGTTYK